ncbi:isoprenyl transferase [Sphingobacterium psychroaquaticum]|uniref:Isoprenyl transferase n=1 Tax=Sphingobacterium psychroaquaticum TaxID=561061 RepID=A0A1X7JIX2_9SPHI|nr:isoprenyl transferase [Sphingobacterium psychroaquaticum]QBQ40720.1 isoprenyl transferase [Sphingobacterium psychroaquaticum]SMG28012.1 undecaprenyl diphosphate synthase [Sphingobacterium psychroaquaticum]
MSFKDKLRNDNLPKHIAIIMDGNGRWAKGIGKLRIFGHQNGVSAVREAMEGSVEIGIKHLTLYAFSSENWNRPKLEVRALMELLVNTLTKETKTFMANGIRLNTIGDLDALPENCRQKLIDTIEITKDNDRCVLTLALSYGSRAELVDATKAIARKVQEGVLQLEDITEQTIHDHLYTAHIPDPDLLIRTGGEQRISNYLLYQMAYTELCFLDKMWPEFKREDLYEAIFDYQQRERRFGKTSEQL